MACAHREDAPDHTAYGEWLESVINGDQAYGMADLALGGFFLQVVTHPRVSYRPSGLDEAHAFVADVRDPANCVRIQPGRRH